MELTLIFSRKFILLRSFIRQVTTTSIINKDLNYKGLVAKIEEISEVPIRAPLFMRKFQRY
ncbi:hypothetical protein VSA01S_27960 [Vibrio sagamiensis NBRC 104589]|uniref:Uncharacterized protein n=1 Tax=Vibrio sagamiensis NBRC 104589 TaxID=1219064 RepID=A0A511QH95_9VIBR|nr:hypothetical protein VSA01S_27960 [Vibrio sagamiensis NBRC 104589]